MPNARDIIDFAQQQQPVEIMKSFTEIMAQRVNDAIADKRIDVAAKMFNPEMDDEELEQFKASYESDDEDEVSDDDSDVDYDSEDEIDDEDILNLTDEEWEELGIEDWDFDDNEDSDNTEEE